MTKAQKKLSTLQKRTTKGTCSNYGEVKHKPMCDTCKEHNNRRFNACVRKTFREEFHQYYEDGVRMLETDFAKMKGF